MNDREVSALDSLCENAMIDKPFHENINSWIEEYKMLFVEIKMQLDSVKVKMVDNTYPKNIFIFYSTYLASAES